MANINTFHLPKETRVIISPDAFASGHVVRLNSGSQPTEFKTITASTDVVLGPFNDERDYRVTLIGGSFTSKQEFTGTITSEGTQSADKTAAGTLNVSSSDGSFHKITVSDDISITFSFTPGKVQSMILELVNAGAHTVTFPESMKFSSGALPSFTEAGSDLITVLQDGKNNVYGLLVGLDVKAV